MNSQSRVRAVMYLQESVRRSSLAHPVWTSCHEAAAAEERHPYGHTQSALCVLVLRCELPNVFLACREPHDTLDRPKPTDQVHKDLLRGHG